MERRGVAGQIESNFFILNWLSKESRSNFAVGMRCAIHANEQMLEARVYGNTLLKKAVYYG
jgi:hypothetical protein